jgi:hypothetical protein
VLADCKTGVFNHVVPRRSSPAATITTTMLLFSVCQKPTSLTLGRAIRKFDRLTNYGSARFFNPSGARQVVNHQQVRGSASRRTRVCAGSLTHARSCHTRVVQLSGEQHTLDARRREGCSLVARRRTISASCC